MLNRNEDALLCLVRCAVCQRPEKLPEGFPLGQLLPSIRHHQIWSLALAGAFRSGLDSNSDAMQQLLTFSVQAMILSEAQTAEANALFRAFSQAGVDYMPLKGIFLRELYPSPEMRPMGDLDILIRTEQYPIIAAIMKRLGFTEGPESSHELNWQKNLVHVELHKCLIPSYNKSLYSYFGDGWSKAASVPEDAHRFAMSPEDSFVYLFAHYAKHYRDGGIGIKHLADLWVFRRAYPTLDEAYILGELKKMELDVFYSNVMKTVAFWFDGAPADEMTEHITRVILASGPFGATAAHLNASAVRKAPSGGRQAKLRWTLWTIFLPYENMCLKYPFLKKFPFLLPVMWVARWFSALFHPGTIRREMKHASSLSARSIDRYRESLASVGLHFDPKE